MHIYLWYLIIIIINALYFFQQYFKPNFKNGWIYSSRWGFCYSNQIWREFSWYFQMAAKFLQAGNNFFKICRRMSSGVECLWILIRFGSKRSSITSFTYPSHFSTHSLWIQAARQILTPWLAIWRDIPQACPSFYC